MSEDKEEFAGWSMELIYDLMGVCGFDVFEEVKTNPNLTEEEKKNFWLAYDHYNKIEYWKTKEPKQGW